MLTETRPGGAPTCPPGSQSTGEQGQVTWWRRPLGTPTLPTPELKEQQSRGGGDPILPCVVVVPSPWESGKSSGSREVSALSEGHRARPTGRGGHAGPQHLAPALTADTGRSCSFSARSVPRTVLPTSTRTLRCRPGKPRDTPVVNDVVPRTVAQGTRLWVTPSHRCLPSFGGRAGPALWVAPVRKVDRKADRLPLWTVLRGAGGGPDEEGNDGSIGSLGQQGQATGRRPRSLNQQQELSRAKSRMGWDN